MSVLLGLKPDPVRGRLAVKVQGVDKETALLSDDDTHTELHIVPAFSGGKGAASIIAGAVLVVVGAVLWYFSAGTLSTVGTYLMKAGAMMMVGGICMSLFPATVEGKGKNYYQGAPGNTTASGTPIALAFGLKVRIAGQIISYNVEAVSR